MLFHWKNKYDLVYNGLNSNFLKAFLTTKIKKVNGKTCSYPQIRKYFDAVMFGAREAKERLPVCFYDCQKHFLASFRKQTAKAKANGDVDEKEADPIPWALFELICTWSIGSHNMMLWTWTIIQWHVMGRSINVEPLKLRNFVVFEDCIKVIYDSNKADQAGEKVTYKHLYANPLNPLVCMFTTLGIYLCLDASKFCETEFIFRRNDRELRRTAAAGYCGQLASLLTRRTEIVCAYIRPDHANAHGLRKGSATHATCGTTCPPPIPSIAQRGEWSMGKVLDVYWHFAQPGDCYLGRVLSGLDPNNASFAILPPHFNLDDPMTNSHVREAMYLMYGPILAQWGDKSANPTGLLLRVLASVVFHFDWVKKQARSNTSHPFNKIPLFARSELVTALSKLITTEPSTIIKKPTGIPPHVDQASKIHTLLGLVGKVLKSVQGQYEIIRQAVIDAMAERDDSNGQVSGAKMLELLATFKQDILVGVDDRIKQINTYTNQDTALVLEDVSEVRNVVGRDKYPPFVYRDSASKKANCCFFQVPKDFAFTTGGLREAWELWLVGMPEFEVEKSDGSIVRHPICPFRQFDPLKLPMKVRTLFKSNWRPIMGILNEAIVGRLPSNPATLSVDDMDMWFAAGIELVKVRASYIFSMSNRLTWGPTTWSKHVLPSYIRRLGTAEDISQLGPDTSKPRKKAKRRGVRKTSPRYVRRRSSSTFAPLPTGEESENSDGVF